MGVAQEIKMAEVNGRVSGVTETISSVVKSMVEERLKNETEALRVQLRKSEGDIRAIKSQSEAEISHLKTETEALSEQVKTNDLQVLRRQMEDEQLTIPMNCFNLVAHNYLFRPSFKWTVNGIKNRIAQKTIELTSEMFQWNGYALKSRVKLRQKEDDRVYLSLCSTDNSESADLKPFPLVYYLLKDINLRNPQHKCFNVGNLFNSTFEHSLEFERLIGRKSRFTVPPYNIDDSNEIEIYVEPSAMTQLVHSYDGTLEWNMENYTRRLQFEIDQLVMYQESPYFYTGPNGYRVQVRIKLFGNEGRTPTARILFWAGKFDDELPKCFSHSTTLTLTHRTEAQKSVSKTIAGDVRNKRAYAFDICTGTKMETMVENDTLFCKVVIKAQ